MIFALEILIGVFAGIMLFEIVEAMISAGMMICSFARLLPPVGTCCWQWKQQQRHKLIFFSRIIRVVRIEPITPIMRTKIVTCEFASILKSNE
jgi:hypothetical protein